MNLTKLSFAQTVQLANGRRKHSGDDPQTYAGVGAVGGGLGLGALGAGAGGYGLGRFMGSEESLTDTRKAMNEVGADGKPTPWASILKEHHAGDTDLDIKKQNRRAGVIAGGLYGGLLSGLVGMGAGSLTGMMFDR